MMRAPAPRKKNKNAKSAVTWELNFVYYMNQIQASHGKKALLTLSTEILQFRRQHTRI
jgi:hypothetical protein